MNPRICSCLGVSGAWKGAWPGGPSSDVLLMEPPPVVAATIVPVRRTIANTCSKTDRLCERASALLAELSACCRRAAGEEIYRAVRTLMPDSLRTARRMPAMTARRSRAWLRRSRRLAGKGREPQAQVIDVIVPAERERPAAGRWDRHIGRVDLTGRGVSGKRRGHRLAGVGPEMAGHVQRHSVAPVAHVPQDLVAV